MEAPAALPTGAAAFPEALTPAPFAALRDLCAEQGFEAYAIGGYVRDWLLGRPVKDIDIVTVGSGVQLAEAFAQKVGSRDVAVFQAFGTAMVRTGDWEVEFVGARKESYRRDSRKPIVEEGTLEDDQLRRDFTVNALSLSLHPDTFGQLHDPFGGLRDLRDGILRTPTDPNVTFSDDPLRMLRAARFAAQLGFEIEDATYRAIGWNADRIEIVSMERVHTELNKTLLAPRPSVGFKVLFSTGLLHLVFPELAAMHGVEARGRIRHKDNFYHTLKVVDNIAPFTDKLWLRWAALLHDIGKPRTKRFSPSRGWTFDGHEDVGSRMVPKIFRRLKLPQNEHLRYVQKLVRLHQRPIALTQEIVTDSALRRIVVDAGEDLDDLLTLCRADITTRDPRREARYLNNYDALEERIREVLDRDALRNWQPPLDGQDIMALFNLKPGRAVGLLKEAVRNAILDGEIPNDRAAALAYVQQLAPQVLGEE